MASKVSPHWTILELFISSTSCQIILRTALISDMLVIVRHSFNKTKKVYISIQQSKEGWVTWHSHSQKRSLIQDGYSRNTCSVSEPEPIIAGRMETGNPRGCTSWEPCFPHGRPASQEPFKIYPNILFQEMVPLTWLPCSESSFINFLQNMIEETAIIEREYISPSIRYLLVCIFPNISTFLPSAFYFLKINFSHYSSWHSVLCHCSPDCHVKISPAV